MEFVFAVPRMKLFPTITPTIVTGKPHTASLKTEKFLRSTAEAGGLLPGPILLRPTDCSCSAPISRKTPRTSRSFPTV